MVQSENTEKECLKLTDEIQEMQNKITDLTNKIILRNLKFKRK